MLSEAESSLWNAVRTGKAGRIPALLASLQTSSPQKIIDELLWFATAQGRAEIVKVLLAAGGNIEQTRAGYTLLLTAAWDGHFDVVRALVDAGARFDRRVEGTTALEAALQNNHVEIANYLRNLGAKWAEPTLLHACKHGDLVRVRQAIAAGAPIRSAFGPLEETPLMVAAGSGQLHVVRFLLERKKRPSPGEVDNALWVAAAASHNLEVIDVLVAAGANVNHANHSGCTVLMTAAELGDISFLKRLVEVGADISAIDHASQSVLDYARKRRGLEASSYLQKLRAQSARDRARDFARKIARAFGGRPLSGNFGYTLKSSLSGFTCLFRVAHASGSVEITDLDFTHPALRNADNAELILGPEPDKKRGTFRAVKGAEQILKVPVSRSVGPGSIRADGALQFLATHLATLRRVLASADIEQIWIGASFARLTWTGSDLSTLQPSLSAFGTLLKAIAHQSRSRPTSGKHDLFFEDE